jgi:hypothetical protein
MAASLSAYSGHSNWGPQRLVGRVLGLIGACLHVRGRAVSMGELSALSAFWLQWYRCCRFGDWLRGLVPKLGPQILDVGFGTIGMAVKFSRLVPDFGCRQCGGLDVRAVLPLGLGASPALSWPWWDGLFGMRDSSAFSSHGAARSW